MQTVFGFKQKQSQVFLEDGTRVPVTVVSVVDNIITQLKNEEKDGYNALQVGVGSSKKNAKSLMGQLQKAKLTKAPAFIREVRLEKNEDTESLSVGSPINLSEVLQSGDVISVTGTSKGKGFAGGVKRHGFHGGPKTHGQSDRHRAPGSIGQGTTPGRVYKGKKMAGHMGHEQVTVQNLYIVDIQDSDVYVAGLIPGSKNTLVRLEKVGEKKNFVPVFKGLDEKEQETEETPLRSESSAGQAEGAEETNESVEKADEAPEQKEDVEEKVEAKNSEEDNAEKPEGKEDEGEKTEDVKEEKDAAK